MKAYTINGKDYSEFDINKKCAELNSVAGFSEFNGRVYNIREDKEYDPCQHPADTWSIIGKSFDFLVSRRDDEPLQSEWEWLMEKHNCTKLVAACICYIELNKEHDAE